MSSNLVLASVQNKGMHLKFVVYNNKLRISVEDYGNGKPSSLLNTRIETQHVSVLLDAIKQLKKDNKPQSFLIAILQKDEATKQLALMANINITQTQGNLYSITVSSAKGNFEFPLLMSKIVDGDSGKFTDVERSLAELNHFEKELRTIIPTMLTIKTEKYLTFMKENPPTNNFPGKKSYGGGGNNFGNQNQGGFGGDKPQMSFKQY